MRWGSRNRPPRWAVIFPFFSCCLVLFLRRNKSAAGVRVNASSVSTAGATSGEVPEVAGAGNYGRRYSLAGAPAYPEQGLEMLQQQWWKSRGSQLPLEQQQQQQPKHVFIQSQQQQDFGDPQQQLNDQRTESVSWTAAEQLRDNPLSQEKRTPPFLYPERVALLSHLQQQQQLHGETSQLQPLAQRAEPQKSGQQALLVTPPLRPVKHHYTFRFPHRETSGKISLLADPGAAGRRAAVDIASKTNTGGAGKTISTATTTTSSVKPPSEDGPTGQEQQLQRQEQQQSQQQQEIHQQQWEEPQQTQQQQAVQQQGHQKDLSQHTQTERLQIPFFSALPEDSWNYRQHGRDWTGLCAEGRRQSPVDLHIEGLHERQYRNLTAMYRRAFSGGDAASALSSRRPWRRGDFFYFYPNSFPTLQVYRSSKVFQLRAANGSMTTLGALFPTDTAEMLTAQHIFFHSPSEHTFQGEANRREVEMQIWHFSDDPITFRASTGVNRTTLPYLALFAEGSLGLPTATTEIEGFSVRDQFGNVLQTPEGAAAAAPPDDVSDREEGAAYAPAVGEEEAVSDRGTTRETTEAARGTKDVEGGDTEAQRDLSGDREAISAAETRARVRQPSAAAVEGRTSQAGAAAETAGPAEMWKEWERFGSQGNRVDGDLFSPTAHWRVVSLTFMSEELDQATVQDLKSLPSERLISTLLQAEMVNATGKPGGETIKLNEPLNLQALMMMLQLSNTEFFAYDGSSTMPPCDENVRWYVARQPLPVATETMLRFYKMLNPSPVVSLSDKDGNFRSLQNVELDRMRNEGNVYLVQGFPMQLLVAASLGFEAMARLPRGEAPALQKFFGLSSSVASAAAPPRYLLPTKSSTTLLLLLPFFTLSVAELLEARV